MKTVTMQDIAREAGVSQPTASRILSGALQVTKLSHQRVLDVAREHNYTPNFFARSLKKRASRCIGLMGNLRSPNFRNPYFNAVSAGIEEVMTAEKSDYSLVAFGAAHPESWRNSLDLVARGLVDGLIVVLIGDELRLFEKEVLPVLRSVHLAFVAVHAKSDELPYHNVTHDSDAVGYLAGRHLLLKDPSDIRIFRPRQADAIYHEIAGGFSRALEESGRPTGRGAVLPASVTGGSGDYRDAFGAVTDMPRLPDALFVTHYDPTFGAYDALVKRGAFPGRDIAFCGVNNTVEERDRPFTYVDIPWKEKGTAAVRMVRELLDGTRPVDTVQRVMLSPRLVVRKR